MSFRDEFLRLLKEDEEFRFAVLGLLGIVDLRSTVGELVNAVKALTDEVKLMRGGQDALRSDVNKLWEENNKIWQELKAIREVMQRHEDELSKIWGELKALREDQNKIWEEIKAIKEENNKIWLEIKAMRKDQEDAWVTIRHLMSDVGGISRSLGKLLERDVRHYLPMWIKGKLGFNVDKHRRVVIENVGEFDGYVEVDDWIIAVEVKATLRIRDANDFINRLARLRVIKANKRITAVLAYVNDVKETAEAIKVLRTYNVIVLRHHGEDDFEEVT